MDAEKLNTIIPRVLGQAPAQERDVSRRNLDMESLWSKIVGERLRGHCYLYKTEKDALVIKVDGSSYLFELNLRKAEILKNLEKESGIRFKKITFTI